MGEGWLEIGVGFRGFKRGTRSGMRVSSEQRSDIPSQGTTWRA